jgi:peptidoglycan/xylan/chitin deacetylase (PgdA/CDA1 family)
MPLTLPNIPILMYHSVRNLNERAKKVRNTNPAYSLSVKQFREQMEYISNNGYKTLHLDQLLPATSFLNDKQVIPAKAGIQKDTGFRISMRVYAKSRSDKCGMTDGLRNTSLHLNSNTHVPEKSLVITFDDGWADNYTNVFPILKEYGLTATVFVITGSVGQKNYMDWNQLREMSGAGISIHSHTVSHKPLAQLSKAEIEYELKTSMKTLVDELGKKVIFLSLPHGVFNDQVLKIAQDAGYHAVCTSEPGFSHEYKNLPVMKRINISDQFQIDTFERILEKNETVIFPMLLLKKVKNIAKRLIGQEKYRKIYQLRYRVKT